jgi:peptidoglycan/LPS O-acetylase OafA/YrhL
MIAVFYLLAPVLIQIDRRPRWYWLVPPLCVLSGFIHRPLALNHTLHACAYFLSSYLAGMFLGRYHETILVKLAARRTLGALTGLLAGLFVLETLVLHRGGAVFSDFPFGDLGTFDFNQIAKLVTCLVILGLLTQASPRVHARLDFLAGASFGVFFVHGYVIKILLKLHKGPMAGGLASLLLLTAAVVALSALLVFAIRKASGRWSRQVVGC